MNAALKVQKHHGEYRVAVYINGSYNEDMTYYACDAHDALSTLDYMWQELVDAGYTVSVSKQITCKIWE